MDLSLIRSSQRRTSIFNPFSLDIRNPFEGFPLADVLSSSETSTIANTRIDRKETPDAHIFKADLPGLKKEEVKVEVEKGRILKISGERSREEEENNGRWHQVKRSIGKFVRRFELPQNARIYQIQASIENGVLTVIVPKEHQNNPEVKDIEISC